jgi:hypothetical protein
MGTTQSSPTGTAAAAKREPDNQALVSLAVLKVNWDVLKKDYLENFVPIVAESIRLLPSDVISLAEVQGALLQHFGLELSQNALRTILQRVKRGGYIHLQDKVYYRNLDALSGNNFREVQQRVLAKHEALVNDLCKFGVDTYGVHWTTADAESALYSYLQECEYKVLTATTSKTMLPEASYAAKSAKFIVASFVQHAQKSHASAFEYLELVSKIVFGHFDSSKLLKNIDTPEPR